MTKKFSVAFLILLIKSSCILAQSVSNYPTDYLSKEFHAGRRAAFLNKMPANTVGIFFAAQQRTRSNDVTFQYAQNKNFYYFTGLEEPNALLLLFKQPVTILNKTGTEFLFVQPKDVLREMWTGKILGPEAVREKHGIQNVFEHTQFNPGFINWSSIDSVFSFYRQEEILTNFNRFPDPLSKMAAGIDSALTTTNKKIAERSSFQILTELRGIKQPEEIELIQKATTISVQAHNEVMKAMRPGMAEYQAQAVMEYYFKKNGSEYPGYPSINGAAENGCVLHYITNQKTMNNGDLLLSDCAAEYHGYTADVTRTIPINGKFSPEQKIIYEIVLKAQDAAFAVSKPGNRFLDPHFAAKKVIATGLVELGIIKDTNEVRTYFPHGTSHHLGLDVHDMGGRNAVLAQGMVYTIEPGIYIPANSNCDKKWWNIGVRIEDDVLITKDGYKNLSVGSPRTVAEIEKMMTERSVFDAEKGF